MKTKLLAAFLLVVGFPVVGSADPIIEVDPLEWDFGDVEVGNSRTTIVTIANSGGHDLILHSVGFYNGGAAHFAIETLLEFPLHIAPGNSIEVVIRFQPTELGYMSARVIILNNDPLNSCASAKFRGEGVEPGQPPSGSIEDILAFIDAAVYAGTLEGSGPGNSANNRLNALINMIEAAGDLIEDGYYEQAYDQLQTVYRKCDGESPPPDFVEGDARDELADMILDLIAVLELLMI